MKIVLSFYFKVIPNITFDNILFHLHSLIINQKFENLCVQKNFFTTAKSCTCDQTDPKHLLSVQTSLHCTTSKFLSILYYQWTPLISSSDIITSTRMQAPLPVTGHQTQHTQGARRPPNTTHPRSTPFHCNAFFPPCLFVTAAEIQPI